MLLFWILFLEFLEDTFSNSVLLSFNFNLFSDIQDFISETQSSISLRLTVSSAGSLALNDK